MFTTPDNITKLFVLNKLFHSFHQKKSTCWEQRHPHNLTAHYQKFYGSNQHWKTRYSYYKRSLLEIAIFLSLKLLR
nr:hypothetical protein [Candidatus Enterovibrio luxaltus]